MWCDRMPLWLAVLLQTRPCGFPYHVQFEQSRRVGGEAGLEQEGGRSLLSFFAAGMFPCVPLART